MNMLKSAIKSIAGRECFDTYSEARDMSMVAREWQMLPCEWDRHAVS